MTILLRLPDDLARRVRPLAAARRSSLNAFFVSSILQRVEALEEQAARRLPKRAAAAIGRLVTAAQEEQS